MNTNKYIIGHDTCYNIMIDMDTIYTHIFITTIYYNTNMLWVMIHDII